MILFLIIIFTTFNLNSMNNNELNITRNDESSVIKFNTSSPDLRLMKAAIIFGMVLIKSIFIVLYLSKKNFKKLERLDLKRDSQNHDHDDLLLFCSANKKNPTFKKNKIKFSNKNSKIYYKTNSFYPRKQSSKKRKHHNCKNSTINQNDIFDWI